MQHNVNKLGLHRWPRKNKPCVTFCPLNIINYADRVSYNANWVDVAIAIQFKEPYESKLCHISLNCRKGFQLYTRYTENICLVFFKFWKLYCNISINCNRAAMSKRNPRYTVYWVISHFYEWMNKTLNEKVHPNVWLRVCEGCRKQSVMAINHYHQKYIPWMKRVPLCIWQCCSAEQKQEQGALMKICFFPVHFMLNWLS